MTFFLKKAASISSGAKTPGKGGTVGKVSADQIREIAETKMKDLNANSLEKAVKMIEGSARSMGLEIVE